MDWASPVILAVAAPALLLVWRAGSKSDHPMSRARHRALLAARSGGVVLAVVALAAPAWYERSSEESVVFVLDHSQSQGPAAMAVAAERASALGASLPGGSTWAVVSAGRTAVVRRMPSASRDVVSHGPEAGELMRTDGSRTDLAAAVGLARGLFPPGSSKRIVLLSDGVETAGDLLAAARECAVSGVEVDAVPVPGEARPDARVVALRASRARLHEGATVGLAAEVESSIGGSGRVRLFENGVEVATQDVELAAGESRSIVFERAPGQRNLYAYRARVEGFEGDSIPENDEALALVDVRGRPLILYVEGEPAEAHYLADSMAREGLRLETRPPEGIPEAVPDLAGYDGVVFSDVPAHRISGRAMSAVRDYVEKLGGGFMMIGGQNSFGVGGYYRTPIEEILPVKMTNPDVEEKYATALALVIDKSGSMSGHKVEICKSAAVATTELLTRKDYIGVVVFDSSASWVVPMTKVTSPGVIAGQIAAITAGGGTNIYPGMTAAREALSSVRAKVKHMIVLTDGQSEGGDYQGLSATLKSEGVTISTVAVGDGADVQLLQAIAASGGGKFYVTADPSNIPRIFTQDAMVHMGRLIREQAFTPAQVESHPMLKGLQGGALPQLLGYVKTNRRATAQVPLVTDLGEPLLAHWRFGLGKVTAFTSDCKSRWASLWIAGWPGYGQFWAQVLREMAREPQGRHMDVRLDQEGEEARVSVDVLADAASFSNAARVEADVFFVPAEAMGTGVKPVSTLVISQEGPGRYSGSFRPERPGVYLVRARSGADLVSAGLVHNPSGEAAAGRVNLALLQKACELTGGKVLGPEESLPRARPGRSRLVELTPLLVQLLILVFMADLAVRRWENIQGMLELARELAGRGRASP